MRNRAASRVAQAHLRALVSRLRGCLSALSSQQQRLLGLRAGLQGAPAGAGAVARILHIAPQREALLERVSLVALRSAAASGCAGSQASSSPTLTSAANAAGAGGQLVSAVSYLPSASAAATTAAGHAGSGTGKVSAGSAGAAPVSSSPGSTGRPPTLGAAGIQRAAVTSTESPALALVVLMLLLGTVVLLKPWRRRSLVAHRTAAPPAAPVSRATPTAPVSPAAPMIPAPVPPAAPASSATVSRWTPTATAPAPAPTSARPAGTSPRPAPAPARPAPAPARPAPAPARPATAAPTANSARQPDLGRASREPGWLRDHAAQGALVATAVAGVIARGLARRSGTGRRR
jgi:hypothetical protein